MYHKDIICITYSSGVDPGFGGADLQRRRFLMKIYAKMKELGPVRGACSGGARKIRK